MPPAIAALPPPSPVPPARPQPAPATPVTADAPGTAQTQPGGALRITFGKDRADLNADTDAALRQAARAVKSSPTAAVTINAFASGLPDDPSAARRLSLSRALAARAVLISEGIPSSRIYPRALGPTGGDTDPDRVDLTVSTTAASAAPAGTPPAPAPAGSSQAAPASNRTAARP